MTAMNFNNYSNYSNDMNYERPFAQLCDNKLGFAFVCTYKETQSPESCRQESKFIRE